MTTSKTVGDITNIIGYITTTFGYYINAFGSAQGVVCRPAAITRVYVSLVSTESNVSRRWRANGQKTPKSGDFGLQASFFGKLAPELTCTRLAKLLLPNSTMYNIDGTTSIVEFETDVLGLLSVVETDPGPQTTAYGLLADFINAVQG
jgi:homoserine dehydrogenase